MWVPSWKQPVKGLTSTACSIAMHACCLYSAHVKTHKRETAVMWWQSFLAPSISLTLGLHDQLLWNNSFWRERFKKNSHPHLWLQCVLEWPPLVILHVSELCLLCIPSVNPCKLEFIVVNPCILMAAWLLDWSTVQQRHANSRQHTVHHSWTIPKPFDAGNGTVYIPVCTCSGLLLQITLL